MYAQPLSNCTRVLLVANLPADCRKRELAHLFRVRFGEDYIDLLLYKEQRQAVVTLGNARVASAALNCLQNYDMGNKCFLYITSISVKHSHLYNPEDNYQL